MNLAGAEQGHGRGRRAFGHGQRGRCVFCAALRLRNRLLVRAVRMVLLHGEEVTPEADQFPGRVPARGQIRDGRAQQHAQATRQRRGLVDRLWGRRQLQIGIIKSKVGVLGPSTPHSSGIVGR